MKGAYLQAPDDPTTAAHVGFLHVWRIAERARLSAMAPSVTDDSVLARRYFSEAVALHPTEARYQGFLATTMLAEASIHKDEKLRRRGYYAMLDAVDAWPEFNLFTAGYVFSNQPAESAQFKEGLEMQWRTLDLCSGTRVDRRNPDFGSFMRLETQQGPKRVCWNSWITPHNFEGFFLNMGDMLVKSATGRRRRRSTPTPSCHRPMPAGNTAPCSSRASSRRRPCSAFERRQTRPRAMW